MKILHVETGRHLYGGPQQVVYLLTALAGRGHDNILVCLPGSGIDAAARAAGITVRNIPCAGDFDLSFAYRLRQLLREVQPDLLHCHSRRGADILGGLAASLADVPALVSRRVDNSEMRVVVTIRYRPFRKIIAISNAIADVLRERGVEEKRLTVIRSAVDTTVYDNKPDRRVFNEAFNVTGEHFVIAAAGQLIPRKGHRHLLQAVADLKDRYPNLRLVLFGEGFLDNQLRAHAAALGLGNVVQFAGFRTDLDDYLACFDLFAHPSLAEGLGVAALKASAAGVAVVGFAAGGMDEAVADGRTGILVPPGNVVALGDAIAQLIEDDARRAAMGAAGSERMQNEFSIATMADKHLELYQEVLNDKL